MCVFVCLMQKQTEIARRFRAQSWRHTIIPSTNIPCGGSVLRYSVDEVDSRLPNKGEKKKKTQFYL